MLHPSTKKLIDKLLEMTTASKLTWLEGDDGTCFYDTEGYRVTIGHAPSRLVLLDSSGRVLETASDTLLTSTTDDTGTSYAVKIDQMVSEARRQVTDAVPIIDRIVSALDLDSDGVPDIDEPVDEDLDYQGSASDRGFPGQTEMASRVAQLALKVNGDVSVSGTEDMDPEEGMETPLETPEEPAIAASEPMEGPAETLEPDEEVAAYSVTPEDAAEEPVQTPEDEAEGRSGDAVAGLAAGLAVAGGAYAASELARKSGMNDPSLETEEQSEGWSVPQDAESVGADASDNEIESGSSEGTETQYSPSEESTDTDTAGEAFEPEIDPIPVPVAEVTASETPEDPADSAGGAFDVETEAEAYEPEADPSLDEAEAAPAETVSNEPVAPADPMDSAGGAFEAEGESTPWDEPEPQPDTVETTLSAFGSIGPFGAPAPKAGVQPAQPIVHEATAWADASGPVDALAATAPDLLEPKPTETFIAPDDEAEYIAVTVEEGDDMPELSASSASVMPEADPEVINKPVTASPVREKVANYVAGTPYVTGVGYVASHLPAKPQAEGLVEAPVETIDPEPAKLDAGEFKSSLTSFSAESMTSSSETPPELTSFDIPTPETDTVPEPSELVAEIAGSVDTDLAVSEPVEIETVELETSEDPSNDPVIDVEEVPSTTAAEETRPDSDAQNTSSRLGQAGALVSEAASTVTEAVETSKDYVEEKASDLADKASDVISDLTGTSDEGAGAQDEPADPAPKPGFKYNPWM